MHGSRKTASMSLDRAPSHPHDGQLTKVENQVHGCLHRFSPQQISAADISLKPARAATVGMPCLL